MKIDCAATSLMALLACTSALQGQAQQSQRNLSELVKTSVDSVVLIVVSDVNNKAVSEGSGFIVSSDGKIVTNHHVIADAHSATVKLNNGAFFAVDGVIADDPDHDLAVIKVSGRNLPSLALADSDSLSAGDHVLAIGSPLGLENSVSDGIVSAFREDPKGRSWIQTTAPASHGNSGGPLLAMDGKVAGVLTWKASEGENLNFAVPSKLIVPLLASSAVRQLGSTFKSDSGFSGRSPGERIWTSLTSGRDFKVRMDDDHIYTEWVNLPPALQSTTAFMRTELKKTGEKWVGKTTAYLPYEYKSTYADYWKTQQPVGTVNVNWCRTEFDFEIDKLSDSRIEGQGLGATSFDARKCRPGKLEWKPFTWIPK